MSDFEELERRVLSDNWAVLSTSRLRVKGRDGSWAEQWRELYDRGDGAAVLPCDMQRGHVLLVRQFRWPAAYHNDPDPMLIETAAGKIEGDDPLATVRAEMREELGVDLGGLRKLFTLYSSPGSISERMHYFTATYSAGEATERFAGLAEEGEETEILDLPFDRAMDMVANGAIRDAKTVILLQWAALNLFAARRT